MQKKLGIVVVAAIHDTGPAVAPARRPGVSKASRRRAGATPSAVAAAA